MGVPLSRLNLADRRFVMNFISLEVITASDYDQRKHCRPKNLSGGSDNNVTKYNVSKFCTVTDLKKMMCSFCFGSFLPERGPRGDVSLHFTLKAITNGSLKLGIQRFVTIIYGILLISQ
jgi:hypothetical protein